jgi:hypothetical protein
MALLGLLFFGVLVVAFVAARSILHAGPDVAPAASASPAVSVHAAASGVEPAAPEVLPVNERVAPAPAPSSSSESAEPAPAVRSRDVARQRPRAGKSQPAAARPPVDTPKPSKPGDVLGY